MPYSNQKAAAHRCRAHRKAQQDLNSSWVPLITICVGWMCGCLSVLFHLFPFAFIHVDENAVKELQSRVRFLLSLPVRYLQILSVEMLKGEAGSLYPKIKPDLLLNNSSFILPPKIFPRLECACRGSAEVAAKYRHLTQTLLQFSHLFRGGI